MAPAVNRGPGSTPTTVSLAGPVRQAVTRFALATGGLQTHVPCSSTPAEWAATVVPAGDVPFGAGYATVALNAVGIDPNYSGPVTLETSGAVRLNRSAR